MIIEMLTRQQIVLVDCDAETYYLDQCRNI